MLYPLSYEGGPGQVSRTTRAEPSWVACPSTGQNGPMADPLLQLAERLAAAFAAVAGRPVDPVVRASDRADAQANGALALAKELGRPPREVAQAVVDAADLDGICRDVEIAGPGFINLTFDDGFLAAQLAAVAADERLGRRPGRRPRARRRRLLGAERRQGDARRAPAHDGDRRRAGAACSTFVGHTVIRENHIGDWGTPFGMLIEHLRRRRRGRGRARAVRRRPRRLLQAGPRPSSTPTRRSSERARQRVVALQGGDPETLRLWTPPGRREHALLRRGLRQARRAARPTTTWWARARTTTCCPRSSERLRRRRAARSRRRRRGRLPARLHEPRRRAAAADRAEARTAASATRPRDLACGASTASSG